MGNSFYHFNHYHYFNTSIARSHSFEKNAFLKSRKHLIYEISWFTRSRQICMEISWDFTISWKVSFSHYCKLWAWILKQRNSLTFQVFHELYVQYYPDLPGSLWECGTTNTWSGFFSNELSEYWTSHPCFHTTINVSNGIMSNMSSIWNNKMIIIIINKCI